MSAPRGLSPEEKALWDRLAKTVKPLRKEKPKPLEVTVAPTVAPSQKVPPKFVKPVKQPRVPLPQPAAGSPPRPKYNQTGLDSHWERRLARDTTQPDFTLDLHGHTLDSAWHRLDSGLVQAKAMGARVVLVVTGKPRPVAAADRGEKRGAIRAKFLDWLAAGPHASDIAAVRPAPRRHGGEGALYLVLKKRG
ncbi:MAG: Smr/MutS family protein [Erythrobacter sp.]|nr:MAG: Smr/MutS family protein [Erythrobacter sp.]